jgi:hypothetical protein
MAFVRLRGRRAACRLGYILAAFFSAASAHAEALPAPIVAWAVPDECPNAQSIVQRLLTLGGGESRGFADAGTVRGAIVKDADEWVLALQIVQGSDGPYDSLTPGRVLRAKDCDELANAAAVAIAIALGGAPEPPAAEASGVRHTSGAARADGSASVPGAGEASRTPSSLASPSTSGVIPPDNSPALAAPAAAPDAVAAPDAAPGPDAVAPEAPDGEATWIDPGVPRWRSRSAFGVVSSVELVLDTTSLGGAAFGPSAQIELRWGALGIGAYGLWLPQRQITVAQAQYVELSLLSAGLRGCYRAARAAPAIDVCGGAEFGALEAEAKGLLDASRRRDPWGAATGGVLLGVDLSRSLRTGARLEAVLPFSRERYLINRDRVVHEVPPASARVALTLAGSFGGR